MSKDFLANYYRDDKKRLPKKARERYEGLSKKGKKKTTIWVQMILKFLWRWKAKASWV